MLLVAGVLADCAPEEIQKRALARYCFLYGEAALLWLRRWRNEVKRDSSTEARARAAEAGVKSLAAALAQADGVRHYLAAKRKPTAELRADDMEGTRRLWLAVNPDNVQAIGWAAIEAFEALRDGSCGAPLGEFIGLPEGHRRAITDALPRRDPSRWYLAADTAADLREYTLPSASGGELGRRIAQINDVAGHLDTLLAIAPICERALVYDFLVRSAMVVELSVLLDLALGPPPNHPRNVLFSLLDLCRGERTHAARIELERMRSEIDGEDWNLIRMVRNKMGAHIDDPLSMLDIQEQLLLLDYRGIACLARSALNGLDAIGATHLGLELLLLGERRIDSWPTDPSEPARLRPQRPMLTGTLPLFFRQMDSTHMTVSGSQFGSAVLMGLTSARKPMPRPQTGIRAARPDPYVEPLLPKPLVYPA